MSNSYQFSTFKQLIDATDASGLNKELKKTKLSQANLQEILNYASLMGDCQAIRIILLCGAKATKKAIDLATKPSNNTGEGGHTMAGLYIKSILNHDIDAKLTFAQIKIVPL
uniref:Uncharacterized protein n=1 Tax=viral metagenome TaxID=1070528 RepID=A0A6C0EZB9_9ZZZZ